ncbi:MULTISPECIES: bifunctional molybdenum cofactor biosynthesis protein MoaC/MoaB [Sphingobacterium]|uniref:bifunctional molybdenum cofactor biosynthesis protein MoaC/MoaB n=1 Tax=Sphingobacterium TaxID=28453 RepID=UPI0013D94771|nr:MULTISPECIES: bifunctional molybdenum cofactor biosynthesis protein MoaC/MoaB [unclassified Sphingobacterium]
MVDITHKNNTLRIAVAQAVVSVSKQETIDAIIGKKVPKGDVFEMAKTAGLFAAKRTADMIPDCHPLPIEYAKISYNIQHLHIYIQVEIKTIYKTGVEVEAMHSASVVALTMYDMLKPIDKEIEIQNIKLIHKKGGKSDKKDSFETPIKTAVLVCSDSISKGEKEDKSGKAIVEKLQAYPTQILHYDIIPDGVESIQNQVQEYLDNQVELILITGGTGLSKRDFTSEAVKSLLDREIPGIGEHLRQYGQNRMPYSILSRSIGGLIGNTLVIALPGSTNGAKESMDALFPHILHLFKMIHSGKHGEQDAI